MRLRFKSLRQPEVVLEQIEEERKRLMDKTVNTSALLTEADKTVNTSALLTEADPDGPPIHFSPEVTAALEAVANLTSEDVEAVQLRGQTRHITLYDDLGWFPGNETREDADTTPEVTIVCCPELPVDEFTHYERLIQEQPVVILPYDAWVYRVDFSRAQLLTIPNASDEELQRLHERIRDAVAERHFRVLVTHEVTVHEL